MSEGVFLRARRGSRLGAKERGVSKGSEVIARSRWFHTPAEPTTFADVEIIHHGRAVQWVSGADYCADALRILADRQHFGDH